MGDHTDGKEAISEYASIGYEAVYFYQLIFKQFYSLAIKCFMLLGNNFCQSISIENSQKSMPTLWSLSYMGGNKNKN
jgi:hypothetical protein